MAINRYWSSQRDYLLHSLETQKLILEPWVYDYLKSLLELECSVFEMKINGEMRDAISEYVLYRRISMFNVYNIALNVFKKFEGVVKLRSLNTTGLRATPGKNSNNYNIFEYKCPEKKTAPGVIQTSNAIGEITILQMESNIEKAELQMSNIMRDIKNAEENNASPDEIVPLYQRFDYLYNRVNCGLTKAERNEIELVNQIYAELLKELDLHECDFTYPHLDHQYSKSMAYKFPRLKVIRETIYK